MQSDCVLAMVCQTFWRIDRSAYHPVHEFFSLTAKASWFVGKLSGYPQNSEDASGWKADAESQGTDRQRQQMDIRLTRNQFHFRKLPVSTAQQHSCYDDYDCKSVTTSIHSIEMDKVLYSTCHRSWMGMQNDVNKV